MVRKDGIKAERENINELLLCLDHGNANVLNKKNTCILIQSNENRKKASKNEYRPDECFVHKMNHTEII